MSPEAIDAMIAAGCTAEQIGAAVKAELRRAEDAEEARRAARREGNRKRQQAWRDRNANNEHNAVTQRDTPPKRKVSPCTPSKENNPPASSEAIASSSAPARDDEQAAFDLFNETAHRNGLPVAEKLTKERRGKLKARLSDAGGLEGWGRAMARLEASDFCAGRRTDFRASIDFVLQPSSFTKLIEGTYDNNPNQRGQHEQRRSHVTNRREAIDGGVEDFFAAKRLRQPDVARSNDDRPQRPADGDTRQLPGREITYERGAGSSYRDGRSDPVSYGFRGH